MVYGNVDDWQIRRNFGRQTSVLWKAVADPEEEDVSEEMSREMRVCYHGLVTDQETWLPIFHGDPHPILSHGYLICSSSQCPSLVTSALRRQSSSSGSRSDRCWIWGRRSRWTCAAKGRRPGATTPLEVQESAIGG